MKTHIPPQLESTINLLLHWLSHMSMDRYILDFDTYQN